LIALAVYTAGAILVHNSSYQPPIQLGHSILMICTAWSVFASRAYNRRHFSIPPGK
jgi:hypothetical protein